MNFRYFEKATIFLHYLLGSNDIVEDGPNIMAFSEYLNFNETYLFLCVVCKDTIMTLMVCAK